MIEIMIVSFIGLFLLVSMLSGIILIYKFLIQQSSSPINIIFRSLILIALLYIIFILMLWKIQFVALLGIILASFIASASVMKSINNTRELEKERKQEEREKAINRLNIYTYQLSIILEKESEKYDKNVTRHFDSYLQKIQNDNHLISNIDTQTIQNRLEFIDTAISEINKNSGEKAPFQNKLKELNSKINKDFLPKQIKSRV